MAFAPTFSTISALTSILGLVGLSFRFRIGPVLAGLSLTAFAVLGLSPIGNMLFASLEQRWPAWVYPSPEGLEGIIVLGGSYAKTRPAYLSAILLNDDDRPSSLVQDLEKRYPAAKIIAVGTEPHETGWMKENLISSGIAPALTLTEYTQTTAQVAQCLATLLHPSPSSHWLLVAYGYRMPRAMRALRKVGFNIHPFPIKLRPDGWDAVWVPDNTAPENMRKVDLAVHEWLALAYYKLKAYSEDWFRAPALLDSCSMFESGTCGVTGPGLPDPACGK